jgi:hypothetical protein
MDPGNEIDLHRLIDLLHVQSMYDEIKKLVEKWRKLKLTRCEIELVDEKCLHHTGLFIDEYLESHWYKGPLLPPWQMYWFELRKYDGENWRIAHMHALLDDDGYYDEYTVLPEDVIKRMGDAPPNQKKVLTIEKVPSKLAGRTLEFKYVRASANLLYGSVKEHRKTSISRPGDIGHVFRAFYHYRDRYREEVARFTMQFIEGLPPLNDDDLQEKGAAQPTGEKPGPPLKLGAPMHMRQPYLPGKEGVDLYYLIELSQTPEISDMLFCKIEELRTGRLKEDVEAYEAKKQHYYKTLFLDKYNNSAAANGGPPLYWFVATQFARDDWALSTIQPEPPAYETHHQVLPRELLRSYFHCNIDTDRVYSYLVINPRMIWNIVNITFVRHSYNCVMGTVQEIGYEKTSLIVEFRKKSPKGDRFMHKMDELDLYCKLSHHLRRPGVVEAFAQACSTQLLPELATREEERHVKPGMLSLSWKNR